MTHPAFTANICGTLIEHPEHAGPPGHYYEACPLCRPATAPIAPNAMSHWLAIATCLTDDERRAILRGIAPSHMRWLVEQCTKYSIPDAVRRIRAGTL